MEGTLSMTGTRPSESEAVAEAEDAEDPKGEDAGGLLAADEGVVCLKSWTCLRKFRSGQQLQSIVHQVPRSCEEASRC